MSLQIENSYKKLNEKDEIINKLKNENEKLNKSINDSNLNFSSISPVKERESNLDNVYF